MIDELLKFIQENWSYILALGTSVAYVGDKMYSFWIDKKRRKQSHNRLFTSVVKLYYSYLKHKRIYDGNNIINVSEQEYARVAFTLDSFSDDLKEFKESLLNESELQPEISILGHSLFEVADRFTVLEKLKKRFSNENEYEDLSEELEFKIKRAQYYSLEEVFDNFFKELINDLKKHTSIKEKYIENLFELSSDKYSIELENEQRIIMKRYLFSLKNQNVITIQEYDSKMKEIDSKNDKII